MRWTCLMMLAFSVLALLLVRQSGAQSSAQPAAKELDYSALRYSYSDGVGLHGASAGEPVITLPAVPYNVDARSTRCDTSALTNTASNPVNPLTNVWDASGSAKMVTLVEGELVNVGKDEDGNPQGVWVFTPFVTGKADVYVRAAKRVTLSYTSYRLRTEAKVLAETYNPDLSTMHEETDEAWLEIINETGNRQVITSEEAKRTGAKAPFILAPEDLIYEQDSSGQVVDKYYQARLTRDISVFGHTIVLGNKFHAGYGGGGSIFQNAELFGVRMWTYAATNGTQSHLRAYDLSAAANEALAQLLRGELPDDPVERFKVITSALEQAEILQRTPAQLDVDGNPVGTLEADWDLP